MSSAKTPKTSRNAATSHRTPSRSAERIGHIEDILSKILLRLPIKSVIKFKSVSKHWLSLISNPDFCRRLIASSPGLFLKSPFAQNPFAIEYGFVNLDRSSNNSSNDGQVPFKSLAFPSSRYDHIGILQSCNGLFLCSDRAHRCEVYTPSAYPKELYVYNPTTSQHTKLPPPPARTGMHGKVYSFSLAFDTSRSPHLYQVVCIRSCDSEEDLYQVEIYSSETHGWRLSGDPFRVANPDQSAFYLSGVFWNRGVHWIHMGRTSSRYFNLDEERMREMPMPQITSWRWSEQFGSIRYFGESGGHLHLIDCRYNLPTNPYNFGVYELKEDYSGWFVKFQVDLSKILTAFPEMVPRTKAQKRQTLRQRPNCNNELLSPLCVVRNHKVDEESYIVLQTEGKIIMYDLKSENFLKICDYIPEPGEDGTETYSSRVELTPWYKAYQFVVSLARV